MSMQDVAAMAGITALIVGIATGYLKIFVSRALGEAESRILQKVEATYPRAELVSLRFAEFEKRLTRLESERGK